MVACVLRDTPFHPHLAPIPPIPARPAPYPIGTDWSPRILSAPGAAIRRAATFRDSHHRGTLDEKRPYYMAGTMANEYGPLTVLSLVQRPREVVLEPYCSTQLDNDAQGEQQEHDARRIRSSRQFVEPWI